MSDIVIKVENLSKQYRLGTVGTGTLSHDLNRWWHLIRGKEDPYLKIGEANDRAVRGNSEYVWALQDINFEVKRGDVVGIIGKNGSGKSTLLKLLSLTTAPTTGLVKMKGRISSLLEVGTGFHPELSGRDNIFLNGAILGMSRSEIQKKFDEIVDFSGVERYLDTPVKRYSSGMYVRLAFAVAAHLEPDILIVDEVLAVGDAEFQKKAIGKMQDVSNNHGRTVLFVSHNMASIQSLCNRGIVLQNGRLKVDDSIDKAISNYLSLNDNSIDNDIFNLNKAERSGNKKIQLTSIKIYALDQSAGIIKPQLGRDLYFEFTYDQDIARLKDIRVDFRIDNHLGLRIAWLSTSLFERIESIIDNKITFRLKNCPLNYGQYSITTCTYLKNEVADWIQNAVSFEVEKGDFYTSGKLPPKEQTDFLINYTV